MGIGNFGLTELFVIVVLVLIFFGPREMPEIARTLARFLRDVQRNVNEIMREFEDLERAGGDGGAGRRRGGESSGGSPRAGDRVLPPGERAGEKAEEKAGERPDDGGAYRAGDEPEQSAPSEDARSEEGEPEEGPSQPGPAEASPAEASPADGSPADEEPR